ncbi:hypothetical protein LYNGBM3L_23130 [Moorena producens 3L]|uniref:Uncharacterized protein n=1 Tax=Moorena producens 3L TaxID=489825 RepID=F4XMY8_9CYAN|nr:hypothetical protein LYNGBM3L_23130 [Moorena producens 3L]
MKKRKGKMKIWEKFDLAFVFEM